MKKSYDYFKTLKDLSACVSEAYFSALDGKNFKKYLIRFSGIRNELSDYLIDDFVTPLERGDIYNLSYCLHKELWQVDELYNYNSLADIGSFLFAKQIGELFNKQSTVIELLFVAKNNDKVARAIDDGMNFCNGIRTKIIGNIKFTLKNSEQPLLAYAVNCAYLTLMETVETTFSEIERILIVKS